MRESRFWRRLEAELRKRGARSAAIGDGGTEGHGLVKGATQQHGAGRLSAVLAGFLLWLSCGATTADAYLYWADAKAPNSIVRANLDGSQVNQSFVTGVNATEGFALDSAHLFWASYYDANVGRAALDGSGVSQPFITTGSYPRGMAVDGSHIYTTTYDAGMGWIGRGNVDGSGTPDQHFISSGTGIPYGLAVDGSHVYWAIYDRNAIGRANLDGSDLRLNFITTAAHPFGVAVDSGSIYWANAGTGAIARANLDGSGTPDLSFVKTVHTPYWIAVGGGYVYWTTDAGTIGRARIDGSSTPEQDFITDASMPFGLAVDSLPHASAPSVSCAPADVTVGATATCTATVTDSGAGASPAGGSVSFSSDTPGGSFGAASGCTLAAGVGSQASCSVRYTPARVGSGTHRITAAYAGDNGHSPGSGNTGLAVRPLPALPGIASNAFAILSVRADGRGRITLKLQELSAGTFSAVSKAKLPAKRRPRKASAISKRRKRGAQNVVYGSASAGGRAGGTVKLVISPTGTGKNALKRGRGKLHVSISVRFTPTGGQPASKSAAVDVRLSKATKHRHRR